MESSQTSSFDNGDVYAKFIYSIISDFNSQEMN